MLVSSIPQFITGRSTLLNGLVGFWKLDGNANDSLGINNGVLSGTGGGWTTGKNGLCFSGDGNSRINFGSSLILKPRTGISVAGWYYFLTVLADFSRVSSDWHQTYALDRWIFIQYQNNFSWYCYLDAGERSAPFFSTAPTNSWVHLAGTWSSGNYMKSYVNGVLANNSAGQYTGPLQIGAGGNICIGRQEEAGAGINGFIDDFGIWDRALSQTEITELYLGGAGKTYPF